MTININLSTESIAAAIRQLQTVKENLQWGLSEAVDILLKEGAQEAQAAYGGMASVTETKDSETSGRITATGDAVIIAEFGAGYATMEDHPFAGKAPVPIEVGSYSRENDGLFYWSDYANPGEGYWYFGGQPYNKVEPRHGLLNAHYYIVNQAAEILKEVIKL